MTQARMTGNGYPRDEHDDLADDGGVTAHRDRVREMLDRIAQEVKQALTEQGIDLSVFLMVPNSGEAIVTFGTVLDPPDAVWHRVGDIVSSIVRQTVGLGRTRCQEVACSATDSVAAPLPTPAFEPAGADR